MPRRGSREGQRLNVENALEMNTDSGTVEAQVKSHLNNRYGEAVFLSMDSPISATENHLALLQKVIDNKDTFNSKEWSILQSLGKIDHDGFKKCIGLLKANPKEAKLPIWKRHHLQSHMFVARIFHEHIEHVENALHKLKLNHNDRNLSWLFHVEIDEEEALKRNKTFQLRAEKELQRLIDRRYGAFMYSIGNEVQWIRDEISRFQKLLEMDRYRSDWGDLHDYPKDGDHKVDLHELYIAVQDLKKDKDKYIEAVLSPYEGRVKLMAKATGVIDYVQFLHDKLKEMGEAPGDLNSESVAHEKEGKSPVKRKVVARGYPDKLLIRTGGMSLKELDGALLEMFQKLKTEGYIAGIYPDFKSIFWPDEPVKRNIRWLKTKKELRYFLFRLLGRQFNVLKDKNYKEEKIFTFGSVFTDDAGRVRGFKARIANSFLDEHGIPVKGKSVISDGSKGPLAKISKGNLDAATDLLRKCYPEVSQSKE